MIVVLSEELSMRDTLVAMLEHHRPELIEGIDWQIVTFQGKADLEKNFPRKMRSWSHCSPHFIILRDNDGGECLNLKKRLHGLAAATGKPFHIRLVCQELEAWLLGDLIAVERAYPKSHASQYAQSSKFRNPDQLGNASEELAKMTGTYGKSAKAKAIAPYLDPKCIRSHSFRVFWGTLMSFLPIRDPQN